MRNTNQTTGLRFFFVLALVFCATLSSFLAPLEALADGQDPVLPAEGGDTLGSSSDTLTAITPTPETVSDWEMLLTLIDIII